MRVFAFLRRHPLSLLGVAAVAFIAWIGADALVVIKSRDVEVLNPRIVDGPHYTERRPNPQGTAQALPKLKPGMTRDTVPRIAPVAGLSTSMVAPVRACTHAPFT
jgi:hypothetical protein